MAAWREFAHAEPRLARAVRKRFEATKHHVLATVRSDGSPRVSGTEVAFHGPDLVLGSMWEARKALDLQRDGRFALHANPGDGSMAGGDAKIAGGASEVTEPSDLRGFVDAAKPPEPFHLFRLDIEEVVLTSISSDGQALVIETWHPGAPIATFERRGTDPPRRIG
jgi:Pyridoxamine 5'-phosphate oxidase